MRGKKNASGSVVSGESWEELNCFLDDAVSIARLHAYNDCKSASRRNFHLPEASGQICCDI